jgi:hypothetical protein
MALLTFLSTFFFQRGQKVKQVETGQRDPYAIDPHDAEQFTPREELAQALMLTQTSNEAISPGNTFPSDTHTNHDSEIRETARDELRHKLETNFHVKDPAEVLREQLAFVKKANNSPVAMFLFASLCLSHLISSRLWSFSLQQARGPLQPASSK